MAIRNIEQERARKAYEFVQKIKEESASTQKEYKAYVKKIPMLIKTSGLGNAFTFVFAKRNNKAYEIISTQVFEWMQHKNLITKGDVDKMNSNQVPYEEQLIKSIINKPIAEYRLIAQEAISLFAWLRRFAEGSIEGEATEN